MEHSSFGQPQLTGESSESPTNRKNLLKAFQTVDNATSSFKIKHQPHPANSNPGQISF